MSLTRLKSFCQARRISSAVGSHWPSWVRSSHNDGRFKHCCIERNQVLTPRSRNLSTGRCLTNETVTPYYDAGDSSLRHSAEIARNTLALPDKEANEGKRKLRTALAEYSLDDDGYMNVRDVVSFLKQENAVDICVIKATGNKRSYVEFLVVVSGVSTRHLRAMAKNLEEMFKGHNVRGIGKGGHVSVEGLESDYWMAVDIGNMVVHFFLPEVREVYELEKLWTLGPQHDDQFRAMLQEDEYLNATHMGTTWNAPGNLHMKSLPEAGTSDK